MKKLLMFLLCFAIAMPVYAKGYSGKSKKKKSYHSRTAYVSGKAATGTGAKQKKTNVKGYVKKDGTSVKAHKRSTADKTKTNNWTTKGNTNPDTGKAGTR